VEPRLGVSRERAAVSMAILTQLIMAAIAMIVGFTVFRDRGWDIYAVLEAGLTLILFIIVFNRLLPFVFFSRTTGRWLSNFVWPLRILIYLILPITLVLGFCQSVAALTREHGDATPETPAEAVDALIEAGQEEGILQEGDRDLIQSVVEFSGKTVRDAMKPRPEMVAVPVNTTVEQAIELLKTKPYSRIPVYEGSVHNIKGILHTQDILQVPDSEAHTRTVDTLMRRDVYFVPESKLVSDLLREMQRSNVRMAMVVDEYGGVAGLVTIEDLVEEIVGEIGDEHEKAQVVRENDYSYVVPGNLDVDLLDELFGVRPEGRESATIAGLVSELAGRIPKRGEVIEDDTLKFEVLDSTDRKVERVRITAVEPKQLKLI
jgi:CBS domain containing-hemolysin-like protein